MTDGIIVDNKEAGVRYAISKVNFDPKTEKLVRELKPGETILGYAPKPITTATAPAAEEDPNTGEPTDEFQEDESEDEATEELQ